MKIEYILLACDNHPKFLSFLPSVAYHWKSMGYKVAFGLVTHTPIEDTLDTYIRSIVDDFYIHQYDTPTCSYTPIVMTKLFRFYLSRYYLNTTVCVQDIDYYVFDKHAHIESLITNPSKEVLTHGFNAYYVDVVPRKPVRDSKSIWLTTSTIPYIQGIKRGDLVFDSYGKLGRPSSTIFEPVKTILLQCELRFPATPMVAHGALIYQIFSNDTTQSFELFLKELSEKQLTLTKPSDVGGCSSFDHAEFSDETLIMQLNRSNGVLYNHTLRNDFKNGEARRRIDPRRSSLQADHISGGLGDKYKELMYSGQILDIQPKRPLEKTTLMEDVFEFLEIPLSLIETYSSNGGTLSN